MVKYTEKQIETILSLPQHLQTTYRTLLALGEATAPQVSKITKKARAVESAYLNQLVNMKILSKRTSRLARRRGRTVYFREV